MFHDKGPYAFAQDLVREVSNTVAQQDLLIGVVHQHDTIPFPVATRHLLSWLKRPPPELFEGGACNRLAAIFSKQAICLKIHHLGIGHDKTGEEPLCCRNGRSWERCKAIR